jgi:hypothetical protein
MEYNKIITEAINEEREEIFEMYKITIQLITKINPRFNEKAKRTPRYTAIPFPPLNLNQIGKICPRKHNRAEK